MALHDLAAIAYLAAAVVFACVAVVAWRREAHNPTMAAVVTMVMAGGCWWSVADAASTSADQTVAAIGTLVVFPGVSVMVAGFVRLGLCLARPQWMPGKWLMGVLLVEPVGITLAALTNPWHLLVYRGPGAAALTGSAGWAYGPLFWADTWYSFLAAALGGGLVGWAWWSASFAIRGQRLAVLLAAAVPVAAAVVYRTGGFGKILDPIPLGIAAIEIITTIWILRRDQFAFSPVARALIVDQIGDAVVVIGPDGRFLDLNPAAADLVRAMSPNAPAQLVGAPTQDLFGGTTTNDDHPTEVLVELPGGRAEFHVHASALSDRHRGDLGTVLVARDVTEANAVGRRLAAAHTELVQQVRTIEALRADLVELADKDPLTGLHNRRHLAERFAAMLAAAEVAGGVLAVALFDVDEFKSVNDSFGHLAGDAVLRALAQRIQALAPTGALVARWGGEEFFVALPGADAATGLAFAEKMRGRCAQGSTLVDGREIRCTVSGGVAAYPTAGTTMDELFHAADHAMYEAKNAGRNLVRLRLGEVPAQRGPGR